MTVNVAAGLLKARVPVLMIYGGKEQLVKVQSSLGLFQELNGHIHSKIYANAAHALVLEKAPRLIKICLRSLTLIRVANSSYSLYDGFFPECL